jgi:hypothetical protein
MRRFSLPLFILFLTQVLSPAALNAAGVDAVRQGLDLTAQNSVGAPTGDLPTLIGTTINSLFALLGAVFLVVVFIGGYLWMVAGGNEEKVGKAKQFITNGINGMIVVFLSYALVFSVLTALRAATGQSQ